MPLANPQKSTIRETYKSTAEKIIKEATQDNSSFDRLAELCDRFGPRFSGTQNLENAINWILEEMERDGLQNVHGEGVIVPRWVRGNEQVKLITPIEKELEILGLGGSIGTPTEGITAEVFVVSSFDDLKNHGHEIAGKIVLYNVPFTTYGNTVQYRYKGAIEAAKFGAVASLIRSVTPTSLNTPHTGGMAYSDTIPKIPSAAITIEDAEMIERMVNRGERVTLTLTMEGKMESETQSRNVIAEIVGREKPEEVIVVGGHIDSWDVGQGAMDDAGGCVAAWEALNLLKKLNLSPRRTIRVVLWTNEENGGRGSKAYLEAHMKEIPNNILAIESDDGVFKPKGFGLTANQEARNIITEIVSLLEPFDADELTDDGSAADISPLIDKGIPGMSLHVDDTKYFWYHHTNADTIDKLDPHELNLCIASLATLIYVVAELPKALPKELKNLNPSE